MLGSVTSLADVPNPVVAAAKAEILYCRFGGRSSATKIRRGGSTARLLHPPPLPFTKSRRAELRRILRVTMGGLHSALPQICTYYLYILSKSFRKWLEPGPNEHLSLRLCSAQCPHEPSHPDGGVGNMRVDGFPQSLRSFTTRSSGSSVLEAARVALRSTGRGAAAPGWGNAP